MDPLSAAGAFATIIGLVCNFKAERSGNNFGEFMTWLEEKRHEDVAASLRNNQQLREHLATLISTNHEDLIAKLGHLDLVLASVAAKIKGFSDLARSIHREVVLSGQAISILRQLVTSGANLFIEHLAMTGGPNEYIVMGGKSRLIQYDEQRFMEDDLKTLVSLGLLNLDVGSGGSRKFLITRTACRLIEEIDSSTMQSRDRE